MVTQDFRAAYASDLSRRTIDLALHAAAAVWLPGSWWMQWIPDAAVPLVWLRSMYSNTFLDERDAGLRVHRALNMRVGGRPMCAVLLLYAAASAAWSPWLAVHIAVHVGIDKVTHTGRWRR